MPAFFSGHYTASLLGTLVLLGHLSWRFQPVYLHVGSPCPWESCYSGFFEMTSLILKVVVFLPYGPKVQNKAVRKHRRKITETGPQIICRTRASLPPPWCEWLQAQSGLRTWPWHLCPGRPSRVSGDDSSGNEAPSWQGSAGAGDDWNLAHHFQNGRSSCAPIKNSNVGHRPGSILGLLSIQSAIS